MVGISKLVTRIIGIIALLAFIFACSPVLTEAKVSKDSSSNKKTTELKQDKKKPEKKPKKQKEPKKSSKKQDGKNGADAVLKTASGYIGVPYRFGGESPRGFDCSGYVKYVFEKHGKKLPRTADAQFTAGTSVDKSKLKEGDLVFFTTYAKGPSHVGIYYGGNKFIHASSSRGIMISGMNDYYWKGRYVGARRIL
jgi:cell wall-associated NlpC family hydrolase